MAIVGQSGNLTPADKKLYALRDVTATVNSIPLITSSIMSKKLAAGSRSIVLDVKVGSGAFMKTAEDAESLAGEMVKIGKLCGRNMSALLTDMDSPLGYAIGNSLEVIEAVDVLRGRLHGDLRDVCIALATEMVSLSLRLTLEESETRVIKALDSGAAFEKMKEWITYQGGDARYIENTDLFPKATHSLEVKSPMDGYITKMDAESIGISSVILGEGREKKDDRIDHSAGIMIRAKVGDYVDKGDVLCTLYTNNPSSLESASERYMSAITIGDTEPQKNPLIYKIVR